MEAIILARRDFREVDQIISAYTKEEGRVDVLARGVKKIISKNASHLEPCSYIFLEKVPGKEIDHLTKVQPIRFFARIRGSAEKSFACGQAVSLVERLVDRKETDRRIFDLLSTWLVFLEKANGFNPTMLDGFVVKLFDILGFSPILEQCVLCDKSFHDMMREDIKSGQKPGFYFAGGGIVCSYCAEEKRRVDERVVVLGLKEASNMNMLLHGDWRVIDAFSLETDERKKLHVLVYEFALYHSERKLPDWAWLASF
jgi:DNA repair protein RecO (recombination protein O)